MPKKAKKESKKSAKLNLEPPQLLRGFRDILPPDQEHWDYLSKTLESFALGYGFSRIDPPILEEAALFVRSIGKQPISWKKKCSVFPITDKDWSFCGRKQPLRSPGLTSATA